MRTPYLIACVILLALAAGCDDDGLRVAGPPRDTACPDVRPFAPGCDGLGAFLHTAGILNTEGVAGGVSATAGIACVADGADGLVVVDACDPARMTVLGRTATPGDADDVAISGDFAYVACDRAGLAVVDVSDLSAPIVVGTARGAGAALDIDVDGAHAYVADDAVGLIVYDVSDPRQPRAVGVENTPGEARGVRVQGRLAYVADAVLGLRIVSVRDPANPWLVHSVATPGVATDVDVVDGIAYVADGTKGLTVIDVSSVLDASVLGGVDTADLATDVRVADGIAFVVDRSDGLLLYDVTAPDSPRFVTAHGGMGAAAVALSRDYAYVADGVGGLRVVDVRRPEAAPVRSQDAPAGGQATALTVDADRIYVSDAALGLRIDDWQDGALVPRGSLALSDGAANALLYEGALYVSGGNNGVFVVDVGDPDRPVIVGSIPATTGAFDVAIADSVCFTARARGLSPTVFDMRTRDTPTSPAIAGVLRGVEVGSKYAYFLSAQPKLFVASLTAPSVLVWTITTGNQPSDLVVRDDGAGGQQLYVAVASDADGRTGVEVYGLDDPRIPALAGFIATSIAASRVAFAGDYLYVAGQRDGLEVFDISDPEAPVPVGSYWRAQPIRAVAAVPGGTLAAAGSDGLLALGPPCP